LGRAASAGPDASFVWLGLGRRAAQRATAPSPALAAGLAPALPPPAAPALSPALVEGGSIAYLTLERTAEDQGAETRFRLGAVGYGPAGAELAERICAQIRAWSPARTVDPVITAYPAGTPDSDLVDGAVIDRPSARLVITY
ncbi:methyltransferase, FxLD system, partial [Streptomyces sp. NPDC054794]